MAWISPITQLMPWRSQGHPINDLTTWAVAGGVGGLGVGGLAVALMARRRPALPLLLGGLGVVLGTVAGVLDARDGVEYEPFRKRPRTAPEGTEPLRVMTLNIRSFRGTMGNAAESASLQQIARAVRQADPDVLLLQEVDRGTKRSGGRDQVAQLARLVGATDSEFEKALDHDGGEYGQGIITRNGVELDSVDVEPLPNVDPPEEPRIAIRARVTTPSGTKAAVLGAHLAVERAVRPAQLVQLARLARKDAESGIPTIVAGDLNDWPEVVGPPFEIAGFRDALTAGGIGTRAEQRETHLNHRAIDHVFVTPDVKVVRADTSPLGVMGGFGLGAIEPVTDHKAVVVDLRLNAGSAAGA